MALIFSVPAARDQNSPHKPKNSPKSHSGIAGPKSDENFGSVARDHERPGGTSWRVGGGRGGVCVRSASEKHDEGLPGSRLRVASAEARAIAVCC